MASIAKPFPSAQRCQLLWSQRKTLCRARSFSDYISFEKPEQGLGPSHCIRERWNSSNCLCLSGIHINRIWDSERDLRTSLPLSFISQNHFLCSGLWMNSHSGRLPLGSELLWLPGYVAWSKRKCFLSGFAHLGAFLWPKMLFPVVANGRPKKSSVEMMDSPVLTSDGAARLLGPCYTQH